MISERSVANRGSGCAISVTTPSDRATTISDRWAPGSASAMRQMAKCAERGRDETISSADTKTAARCLAKTNHLNCVEPAGSFHKFRREGRSLANADAIKAVAMSNKRNEEVLNSIRRNRLTRQATMVMSSSTCLVTTHTKRRSVEHLALPLLVCWLATILFSCNHWQLVESERLSAQHHRPTIGVWCAQVKRARLADTAHITMATGGTSQQRQQQQLQQKPLQSGRQIYPIGSIGRPTVAAKFAGPSFASLWSLRAEWQVVLKRPLVAENNNTEPTQTGIGAERSQFGDLVAIGAISLIEPPSTAQQLNETISKQTGFTRTLTISSRQPDESSLSHSNSTTDSQRSNKLDYIVDFMRTNKLTKFCDLLTNQEPEIKALNERLNSLGHFTLFVPTNEALLLMPSGQLERIKSGPSELKQFLMAHLTSELVVPRLSGPSATLIQPATVPVASTSLVFSLAGSQMRVSTVPIQAPSRQPRSNATNQVSPQVAPLAANQDQQVAPPARNLKLELIVNGANVVSGHSYALQEPDNSSVTYAIVHLIDRALYPVPTQNLRDKIRSLAPRMAKYLEQAGDSKLNEWLESSQHLSTLFLPNDDAFRATPSKLLDHLDTNHTFLTEFLRAHLVEGLYYSQQLASGTSGQAGANPQVIVLESERREAPNKLFALSGAPLEFESRTLQSRALVLVNSIPIVEPDMVALNGVVHLITRPIFERHLLEECRCGGSGNDAGPSAPGNSRQATNLTELAIYEKLWPASQNNPNKHNVVFDTGIFSRPEHRSNLSNWFHSGPENPTNGNELEREESQPQQSATSLSNKQVLARSLRAGLFTRNNRDFYRPSAAPANLMIVTAIDQQQQQQADMGDLKRQDNIGSGGQIFIAKNELNRMLNNNGTRFMDKENSRVQVDPSAETGRTAPSSRSRWENAPANSREPPRLFEVDRYKVVLNATSRQRMREQQRDTPSATNNQFVYDQPLLTSTSDPQQGSPATTEPYLSSRRPYLEAVQASNSTSGPSNSSGWVSNVDQLSLAASRMQRVLKFQPEDARDPLPGTRIQSVNLTSSGRLNNLQPAYDVISSSSNSNSNRAIVAGKQQSGQISATAKTVPPPAGFGCAFYDTECKRLVGRLVHLPPLRAKSRLNLQASASNQSLRASPAEQHLDSTFGEATENPNLNIWAQTQQPGFFQLAPNSTPSPKQRPSPINAFVRPSPPRVSPLNQPLPPLSLDEEHRVGHYNWRAQDGDIARIVNSKQPKAAPTASYTGKQITSTSTSGEERFTGGISRETPTGGSKANGALTRLNMSPPSVQNLQAQNRPSPAQILLVPVKVIQEGFVVPMINQSNFTRNSTPPPHSNNVLFGNQQFHTPTPYSVSPITTHMPPMFSNNNNNPQLSRLTNFTAFETPSLDEDKPLRGVSAKNLRVLQQTETSQVPRAPSAHRKQRLQQVHLDNNGALGTQFELNPSNGEKQARKIVRIQSTPSGLGNPSDFFTGTGGDISITSARLTALPGRVNITHGGLATQASQPAPNVSANFVRSLSEAEQQAAIASNNDQNSDFFQNRTIAEIMDDSGLRIDGQQVTFGRLKECLAEAELLSLVSQTGNSLTIFMPTDTAFQRLIQQQVIAHQRERQQAPALRSTSAGRLLDSISNRHLIPLVGRRPSSARLEDSTTGIRLEPSSSASALSPSEFNSDNLSGAALSAAGDRITLDCSTNQVRQILLDHLSSRLVTPKQLQSDMGISSLSGHQLLLSSVPSKKIVVVDGQPVIAATRAKNGMVYVVNKFLNLTQQVPNVVDLIETQPNLTTFLSYLSFSSLANRLRRETGPLTVLAPTNEAFEQLSSSARHLINSDPSALMDILRGHIVEGAQFGKLISMRNRLKTMNADQNIEAKVIKPNLYLLDNQMTSMKLVGTTGNGVVNAIDRLIVPAWLKVSMATRPANETRRTSDGLNSFLATSGNGMITGSSSPVAELDASTARASGRTVSDNNNNNNNLPLIGNRPLRFEQPTERLTTPNRSGGSSFLFAKNDNRDGSSNLPFNNNILDFDPPAASIDNSSSLSSTPASGSPFLRVANNITSGGDSLSRPTLSNVNKNMQLIEKLSNLMQAKKFVRYLFRSRLSESLKPDMNYVILVPTDQAIDKLPKQIIDMLERDPERLADLVNYHVLDTTFEYINTIPDGQTLNTLNEKDILFNWHRNNTILTASGAVVMGGIQEENIALLIVDRVLYPTPGDILNIISKSPILSNFTSLVRNAGLEQQLSLAGPFTLFAPSDFAFNQLDRADIEFMQRNKETARRFLLRHLSQPAVFTSSIALSNSSQPTQIGRPSSIQPSQVPTMIISNSLGEDLTLRQRNDYFSVNEVNFSYADVAATNGVVHVIDGLL